MDPLSIETNSEGDIEVCYNTIFETLTDGPTTAQLLVMFDPHFVEHCGKIYAAPPDGYFSPFDDVSDYFRGRRGLYLVTDGSSSCVKFCLLYLDNAIGQIVASAQFDPIEIIGVSGTDIYGYYEQGGFYARKKTEWGDATDGSLIAHLDEDGIVSGISSEGYMFNLWGSFENFNYARHGDADGSKCASGPASIDDWTGFLSGSRGTYCPSQEDGQLWKYTWNPDPIGGTFEKLSWTAAKKVHMFHLIRTHLVRM